MNGLVGVVRSPPDPLLRLPHVPITLAPRHPAAALGVGHTGLHGSRAV